MPAPSRRSGARAISPAKPAHDQRRAPPHDAAAEASPPRAKATRTDRLSSDVPRPFDLQAFARQVRDVEERRQQHRRRIEDGERRAGVLEERLDRMQQPVLGWFRRGPRQAIEDKLARLVEELNTRRRQLQRTVVDANFAVDGRASALFGELARRHEALHVAATDEPAKRSSLNRGSRRHADAEEAIADRNGARQAVLDLVSSPTPPLRLGRDSDIALLIFPCFVAVASPAGPATYADIRQLFITVRASDTPGTETGATGGAVLATLPNGLDAAYSFDDHAACEAFAEAFATYLSALPELIMESPAPAVAETPPAGPASPPPLLAASSVDVPSPAPSPNPVWLTTNANDDDAVATAVTSQVDSREDNVPAHHVHPSAPTVDLAPAPDLLPQTETLGPAIAEDASLTPPDMTLSQPEPPALEPAAMVAVAPLTSDPSRSRYVAAPDGAATPSCEWTEPQADRLEDVTVDIAPPTPDLITQRQDAPSPAEDVPSQPDTDNTAALAQDVAWPPTFEPNDSSPVIDTTLHVDASRAVTTAHEVLWPAVTGLHPAPPEPDALPPLDADGADAPMHEVASPLAVSALPPPSVWSAARLSDVEEAPAPTYEQQPAPPPTTETPEIADHLDSQDVAASANEPAAQATLEELSSPETPAEAWRRDADSATAFASELAVSPPMLDARVPVDTVETAPWADAVAQPPVDASAAPAHAGDALTVSSDAVAPASEPLQTSAWSDLDRSGAPDDAAMSASAPAAGQPQAPDNEIGSDMSVPPSQIDVPTWPSATQPTTQDNAGDATPVTVPVAPAPSHRAVRPRLASWAVCGIMFLALSSGTVAAFSASMRQRAATLIGDTFSLRRLKSLRSALPRPSTPPLGRWSQFGPAALIALAVAVAATSPLLQRAQPERSPTTSTPMAAVPPPKPAPEGSPAPAAKVEASVTPSTPPVVDSVRTLSVPEVAQVQRRLRALGFNPGPVDGLIGPRTVAAAREFQAANGLPDTGLIDSKLLEEVSSRPTPWR